MRLALLMAATAMVATPAPALADGVTAFTVGRFPVISDGRTFVVAISNKSQTILIQGKPRSGDLAPSDWPIEWWRTAVEKFVAPSGCGISTVSVKWKLGGTWEATYVCPAGVDLRALAEAQKKALKTGAPLTVTTAP